MILATAILFTLAHANKSQIKTLDPWRQSTVVNATSTDGYEPEPTPDPHTQAREMRDLRKKIKLLEADIDALKRQSHAPE